MKQHPQPRGSAKMCGSDAYEKRRHRHENESSAGPETSCEAMQLRWHGEPVLNSRPKPRLTGRLPNSAASQNANRLTPDTPDPACAIRAERGFSRIRRGRAVLPKCQFVRLQYLRAEPDEAHFPAIESTARRAARWPHQYESCVNSDTAFGGVGPS